jgi:hypothetical protein
MDPDAARLSQLLIEWSDRVARCEAGRQSERRVWGVFGLGRRAEFYRLGVRQGVLLAMLAAGRGRSWRSVSDLYERVTSVDPKDVIE